MCGIFGYIGKIDKALALQCLNTLSHRGPDGYGLVSVGREEGVPVTLGHRRLSILDLSPRGSQPMSYKGRYTITFNGEIYNFVEIKKELQALGHSFVSESDTEVIMAAYDEWQEKCLDRFNGMWAFAIWDDAGQSLFLSRDRFGEKPLFYSEIGNDFCFASEMKAIAPLLKSITPDTDILKDREKIFYHESTDRCLIKEIKRFPAGYYGYVKNSQLALHRFWNTLDHIHPVPESYEEQVKKFRKLFADACAIRIRADVKMGTALSGGLDSSSVFSMVGHIAKIGKTERASKDWQHAFCASFPGTPLDETAYAQKAADFLGVPLQSVIIDPDKYIDHLSEYFYLFEDIYLTSPIPFVAVYKTMHDNGVKVTLDGHGADELFGGYSFDYLHIIHDELLHPGAIRGVLDTYYQSQMKGDQFKKTNHTLFAVKQIVKNLAKIITGRMNHSREENHPAWKKMDYFTQKLYITSHETVLPTLLRNYDRYSMMNGVEIRMPFLDHRIVTYALSLPWQSKIRNGFTKSIIRDAMKPYMPDEVTYRKSKFGFNSPTTDWLRGPLKNFITKTTGSDTFKNSAFVDAEKIKKQVQHILHDPHPSFAEGEALWTDLSPYLWEQDFLERIRKTNKNI